MNQVGVQESKYHLNEIVYSDNVCPNCGSYDWSYYVSSDNMKCGDCGKTL
jgi:ribosomal protein S27E